MQTAEAIVETDHPSRYLVQLCKHAGKMGSHLGHRPPSHDGGAEPPQIRHAEWSETDGLVVLNLGQWTMHAIQGELRLRAEADSQENLRQIQDLLTVRLEKIGRRDGLRVNWQASGAPAARPGAAG